MTENRHLIVLAILNHLAANQFRREGRRPDDASIKLGVEIDPGPSQDLRGRPGRFAARKRHQGEQRDAPH
jgi:hypothetical protein